MPDLEPVDESWNTALCVVAHPDDLEFGTAAAVARWTDQGKTVVYAMVTSGEAGIDGLDPAEARRVREAEQRESARIVGVEVVDFLGLTDGVLEYGVELRRAICTAVRRHRPEIVITNNFRDTWGGQTLNQADHIATGRATFGRGTRCREPLGLSRADRGRVGALGRGAAGVGCFLTRG
jgi:LmbE family N-acetylglucosaminyl deacetylase